MPTEQTDSADCSESKKNAGHGRIARRIGMRGISHTVHIGRAANRRHTSPNRDRNRWWIRRLPQFH
ncbi:hypothetical protein MCC01998_14980 [Bifidobacteriaceae bacterium MCC01998]|nr:hypothetical protein MCC02037_15660 [Bifidobacteriaceae bacterium MCC02037]GDZ68699.1 hypothetical protein MCC01988_15660 [Bifidobacteriaceae bacterium MCC01988]GDZ74423.1 hypothetical protein MCC01998_14980 [Bifidobacteriaceae bacterium MCC01998]